MFPSNVSRSCLPSWPWIPALLLLLPASHAPLAVTLQPGVLGPALTGTGCLQGDNCDFCHTSCAEAGQNTANASIYTLAIPGLNPFLDTAFSHVYTEFTVAPPEQGEGDWVTATVYYDIEWRGLWTVVGVLTGGNKAEMKLDLAIQDAGDLSKILAVHPVHTTDPNGVGVDIFEVGGWTDRGREQGSFTTQLRRGHAYRLTHRLDLRTLSYLNAYYALDYATGGFGAWWNDLRVALGPDPLELVAGLEARIDTLEHRLEHHGHEYLTGRGEGHNNTVATTGLTVFFDDFGDTTGARSAGDEIADATPVSVILQSSYPNPARRATILAFELSAPSRVTIQLYNVHGQLVATLADEWMEAGERRVPFDVRALASGVYFYRLTAGPFTESRRLVVK